MSRVEYYEDVEDQAPAAPPRRTLPPSTIEVTCGYCLRKFDIVNPATNKQACMPKDPTCGDCIHSRNILRLKGKLRE